MKKALLILGLAAMAAGCHTADRNSGGAEMDATTSTTSQGSYRDVNKDTSVNPATQGSGANSLNNTNSNSNPNQ